MEKTLRAIGVIVLAVHAVARPQVVDSFNDGDFTTAPSWTGTTSAWQIVTDSDVAAGAVNSFTLRLNAGAVSATEYLSTQRTGSWGVSQSWSFWLGRRAQAATGSNFSLVWLWASEADLTSATVDGYRVKFGDNTGGDNIVLQRVDDGLATDIITSAGEVANGLTDVGFQVRVTRTSGSDWTLYTSVLPTVAGEGISANAVPNSAGTAINQGSVNDAVYTEFSNGLFGFAAVHTSASSAATGAEFDQLYFDPDSNSPLPVQLTHFSAVADPPDVVLRWQTESETNNYGFGVERRRVVESPGSADLKPPSAEAVSQAQADETWSHIGFVQGSGMSSSRREYSFVDHYPAPGLSAYRLKQIDLDGAFSFSDMTVVEGRVAVREAVVGRIYPNPFNPLSTIEFTVPESRRAALRIFDLPGREVAVLFDEEAVAGKVYQVSFDGSHLPSGMYLCSIEQGHNKVVKKLLLLK